MRKLTGAEHSVLHTLDRIGSGYGLQIVELAQQLALSARSRQSEIKRTGVYVLLSRMQHKDFVRSEYVDPEPGERGPKRRVYYPTALGKRMLRAWEAHEAVINAG